MSPSEAMPTPVPDDLERRLRAELDAAVAQLQVVEREYQELLADPSVIQEDRDTTRTVLENARHAAEAARRAVERFEAGDYGRCKRCGATIPAERLEAAPDAEICLTCAATP